MTLQQLHQLFISELANFSAAETKAYFDLLLKMHTGLNSTALFTSPEREISPAEELGLRRDLAQLQMGVPVQQVMGYTHFMGLRIQVNEHCLIPRPETEELIFETLNRLQAQIRNALDIGTGSGCIALAIKKARAQSKVYALEKSRAALNLAQQNARENNLEVNFIEADMQTFEPEIKYDLIISNPPYIRESEKASMERNVLEHEPHMALFVKNHQPLVFYEAIARIAKKALSSTGLIALEINQEPAEETAALFASAGFKTQKEKDLSGNWRFIWARH